MKITNLKLQITIPGDASLVNGVGFVLLVLAAAAPAAEPAAVSPVEPPLTAADREHWAFRPLARPAIPAVKGRQWCRTPIDRFILAKLESAGLAPLPRADRRTLIRRVTFD